MKDSNCWICLKPFSERDSILQLRYPTKEVRLYHPDCLIERLVDNDRRIESLERDLESLGDVKPPFNDLRIPEPRTEISDILLNVWESISNGSGWVQCRDGVNDLCGFHRHIDHMRSACLVGLLELEMRGRSINKDAAYEFIAAHVRCRATSPKKYDAINRLMEWSNSHGRFEHQIIDLIRECLETLKRK